MTQKKTINKKNYFRQKQISTNKSIKVQNDRCDLELSG